MTIREQESLGDRVRRLRLAAELSQAELARQAQLSHMTIQRLEAGKHDPSELTLQRVARVLKVTVSELCDGLAA